MKGMRVDLKICTRCTNELPSTTEYFHKSTQTKDGLRYWCKDCVNKVAKEYRIKYKKYNLKHEIPRDGSKTCINCGKTKSKTEFHLRRSNKCGLSGWCKECSWIKQIFLKFNITLEQYNKMLESQDYKCAICNNKINKRRLDVDHDHKTGKIRGLLCSRCNIKIEFYINYKDIIDNYLGRS